jgi:hypothetical protein
LFSIATVLRSDFVKDMSTIGRPLNDASSGRRVAF